MESKDEHIGLGNTVLAMIEPRAPIVNAGYEALFTPANAKSRKIHYMNSELDVQTVSLYVGNLASIHGFDFTLELAVNSASNVTEFGENISNEHVKTFGYQYNVGYAHELRKGVNGDYKDEVTKCWLDYAVFLVMEVVLDDCEFKRIC